jgi:AAA domain
LKGFNELNFPMARYFIELEKKENFPVYLTHEKQFSHMLGLSRLNLMNFDNSDDDDDFNPYSDDKKYQLDKEFRKLKLETISGYDESYKRRNAPVEVNARGTDGKSFTFKILEADSWPDAEGLGLDSSQYSALQAALTKELVVIQGPPGTGKTYMALKIAEILIENKRKMGRTTPILVVCLTNHALDQFLVGMMPFTNDIVRIGGQSKRTELDAMNLKNKHMSRTKDQHLMILHHRNHLQQLHNLLDEVERRLYAVEKGLSKEGFVFLSGTDLKNHLLNGLLGAYLCMFLNHEEGYIAFSDVRHYIHEWKIAETENIFADHSISEASSYKLDIDQKAYYLEAELDFLESHIHSYELIKLGAVLSNRKQNGRLSQMSVEEKLDMYFKVLNEQRDLLTKRKLQITDKATEVSQILDEIRWMEQIRVLEDQDVIGLTTTGAARLQKMLSTIGCEIGNIINFCFLQLISA